MSRRFNRGGDNDSDYLRCLLSGTVSPNNVTMAACFARELDDGNFQTIAQMGNAGVDTSRVILGIPSSSDSIRAAQTNAAGTTVQASTSGAVTNQRFYVGCGRWVSATSRTAERTGAAVASNSTSNTPGTFSELLIGRKSVISATFESWPGWLQWVAFWRTAVSAAESAALCQQWEDPRNIRPDALIALVDFKDYRPVYYAPRNALTFNVVGDPDWQTYGPYPIRTRRRSIFVPTSGAVTGDLAATEDADTAAIAGEVDVSGDLAVTEAADVAAIAGEVEVQGDLSVTEAADAAAIDGSVLVQGDLAVTEAADVADIEGELGALPEISGDLDATEGSDVAAIDGQVLISGDMAATEEPDVSAIDGSVLVQGDLDADEAGDVAAIEGGVLVQGDLDVTEEADVAAINGSNDLIGSMAATEEPDTAEIEGSVLVQGSMAVTDGPDTATVSGEVDVTGDLSVTEASDTFSAEGTVEQPLTPIIGDMAVTEGIDVAAIAGLLERSGTMAATEGADTAAITGTVAQVFGDPLPRANLPYVTRETARFEMRRMYGTGPGSNAAPRTIETKNGSVDVEYLENVETTPPRSTVPGQS